MIKIIPNDPKYPDNHNKSLKKGVLTRRIPCLRMNNPMQFSHAMTTNGSTEYYRVLQKQPRVMLFTAHVVLTPFRATRCSAHPSIICCISWRRGKHELPTSPEHETGGIKRWCFTSPQFRRSVEVSAVKVKRKLRWPGAIGQYSGGERVLTWMASLPATMPRSGGARICRVKS